MAKDYLAGRYSSGVAGFPWSRHQEAPAAPRSAPASTRKPKTPKSITPTPVTPSFPAANEFSFLDVNINQQWDPGEYWGVGLPKLPSLAKTQAPWKPFDPVGLPPVPKVLSRTVPYRIPHAPTAKRRRR